MGVREVVLWMGRGPLREELAVEVEGEVAWLEVVGLERVGVLVEDVTEDNKGVWGVLDEMGGGIEVGSGG